MIPHSTLGYIQMKLKTNLILRLLLDIASPLIVFYASVLYVGGVSQAMVAILIAWYLVCGVMYVVTMRRHNWSLNPWNWKI